MDTENQTNQVNEVSQVKRGRGRPRSTDKTRNLYLNPETHQVRSKGKPAYGSKWLEVAVQRAVKPSEFVWGTTPIVGEPVEITVVGKVKPASNINVTIIEPTPAIETSEVADSNRTVAPAIA